MSAPTSILESTSAHGKSMTRDFQDHCNAPRIHTETYCLNAIRNEYPGYHVTVVKEDDISLFEFANSGKAVSTLDHEHASFDAIRQWSTVGDGVEKKLHPGSLDHGYRFARFEYTWSSNTFLLYYVRWTEPFRGPSRYFYILSPVANSTIEEGHCVETDALILAAGKWTNQLHDEIFVFDDGSWNKSKELWNSVNGASWADVILNPTMKENLIQDVAGFFDNKSLYEEYAVPWKRGIILHGPPGNGKTVSIRALMATVAASTSFPIPSLYVKSLETSCSTEQWAIREIFQKARDQAPCLLVFEDLDSLVGDKVRSYFLNEVDGLESNDGILMIGSTNYLERLDPAIAKRPSRFDRKYLYSLPGVEERKLYGEYWSAKLKKNGKVEVGSEVLDLIAEWTEGFSFAYLKELWVMALLSLVRGFDVENADKDSDADGSWDGLDSEGQGEETEEKKEEEQDVCTCAAKCKTCEKPLPAPASDNKADAEDEKTPSSTADDIIAVPLPNMVIPSSLADSLLLKVIKHHIVILHKEMDNTKPASKPKTECAPTNTRSIVYIRR